MLLGPPHGKLRLLHLDVEGCEYEALVGASASVKAGQPTIVYENNKGENRDKIMPLLDSWGYGLQKWDGEIEKNAYAVPIT